MLGRGAYGYVNNINNQAVKKFVKLSHLTQEYTALQYLKDCQYIVHANNVNYQKLELSMELYDCSLRQYMQNDCLCEDCITIILSDVLKGLMELQTLNLSHSDLKPGNILIKRNPLKAVLGDCGFVSLAQYSKQQRTARSYRDLVVVNDDKHDMFSFGIILLELIYKVKPYIQDEYTDYLKLIDKKVTLSSHRKLLRRLLNKDRTLRPNAAQALECLYKQTFTPINITCQKKYDINHLYQKYSKHKIVNLKNLILHIVSKLNIKRSKRGYEALLSYMEHNTIKHIDYYGAAAVFILASLFGNQQVNLIDIIKLAEVNNKHQLIETINILTKDENFVKILFY